jgi:GMP synthase-like glutamine amidotransferase
MKRIALLQADWVNPEFIGPHGDLGDMIERFLQRHAPEPTRLDVFKVLEGELPRSAADYDLLLVPGSRFSAYDDFPGKQGLVELLREGREVGSKILGLCFGAQLIAVAFGGDVGASEYGWNVGLKPVSLLEPPEWLEPGEAPITVLFNHKDRIRSLPEGFQPLLSTPDCPLAGFQCDGTIVGLQFHPEYTLEYQEALMSISTTLPTDTFQDAVQRNRSFPNEGGRFTGSVLRQLLGTT